MQVKLKKNVSGFTLVELMTVMAIIAILATSIIVSLSAHKKRAAGAKALAEMSAVIQDVYLCISDDGAVVSPDIDGGEAICNIGGGLDSNYGSWPSLSGALVGYSYDSGSNFLNNPWRYSITNSADSVSVCCNSTSGRCQKFEPKQNCTPEESLE